MRQRKDAWSMFSLAAIGFGHRVAAAGMGDAHGQDGHLLRVIEQLSRHPQPLAEAVAIPVCERLAGFLAFAVWCLPGAENSGTGMPLKYRSRTQWHMLGATGAALHLRKQPGRATTMAEHPER